MSFARGDLARRAALADNLAVPEPWSSNDDPRVFAAIRDLKDEFRRLGITDEDGKGRLPDFLLDYENLPPIKPTTLDRAHARNSAATRWDQNGNLVEDSSDTLRLQRDPATQDVGGLLYEPKRTQLLSSPQDLTSADWSEKNVTTSANVGSAKGQNFYSVVEDNTTNERHLVHQTFTTSNGDPASASIMAKENGRSFIAIEIRVTDGSNDEFPKFWFDLSSGSAGVSSTTSNTSLINHFIKDLGGGWYRANVTLKPSSSFQADKKNFHLANADGSLSYDGDGTSGIFVMHAQAEVSREVTSPILDGDATRGADTVNYGFSFPDKTTGVAYSIEQQNGDAFQSSGQFNFGNTSNGQDGDHGVLLYEGALNRNRFDGFLKVARNSSDRSPLDDTIERVQVKYPGPSGTRHPIFTVRQIAIHTQPHTQAQKDTLRDQYLTQP